MDCGPVNSFGARPLTEELKLTTVLGTVILVTPDMSPPGIEVSPLG